MCLYSDQIFLSENFGTIECDVLVPHGPINKQGNQRWQIPRPATCQCLETFTPLKSKILIFFRYLISLLARVFILLIDTATQEVPMKNILKEIVSPVFEIRH